MRGLGTLFSGENKKIRKMSKKKPFLRGIGASAGTVTGRAKLVLDPSQNSKMERGDILVTPITNPLFTPAIMKASAIVTDLGGALSHTAVVSRELGIPAVVGTHKATKILKDGVKIIVNGKEGIVYERA